MCGLFRHSIETLYRLSNIRNGIATTSGCEYLSDNIIYSPLILSLFNGFYQTKTMATPSPI